MSEPKAVSPRVARRLVGSRAGQLALAALAAVVLLSGVLNVRAMLGDEEQAWVTDPAASSPADLLVGAPPRPASKLDGQILSLQDDLRAGDENGRAVILLGQAYLQKARETGDPSYYPKAEALFDRALAHFDGDFAAMVGLGTLALARHEFAEALDWGERARTLNPHHAPAHGVIGDALVELGRYEEAAAAVQAMVDLRPDLTSYARVSHVRELHGDRDGAITAMEQAAVAGAGSPENVAWTQTQLGNLRFDGGDLAAAERSYAGALAILPGYVYALAGQARVAAAQGNLDHAAGLYGQAIRTMPLPEFVIALGDVYDAGGRAEEATQQYALVDAIQQLFAANGVNTDLELALFDADHGRDLASAVERAREQYAERPSIIAADVLAWTLYQNGDDDGAREASRQALRLGTRNALMLFHAGMIEARLGNTGPAAAYLQAALDLNPSFSVRYADDARATLDALRAGTGGTQSTAAPLRKSTA